MQLVYEHPLGETIDISLDFDFKDKNKLNGLSSNYLRSLLKVAASETHFTFNNNIYNQVNGVVMGAPLAPLLASMLMKKMKK